MLQKYSPQEQVPFEDGGQLFTPAFFLDILKRRWLFFLVPFALVAALGTVAVMLVPAIYQAEGKILIESQQIPTDLVRPTVSTLANERIQVIEQRIMTRDNLLAIANKFQLYSGRQQGFSASEMVDFIRDRTEIKPLPLKLPQRNGNVTIAFTVGFEHEQPATAMRVATEFVTMILAEDVRVRTNFAAETTRFLDREVRRLDGELNKVETKLAELKRKQAQAPQNPNELQVQALRAELLQKSATYSPSHPDMKIIKQKLEALEKTLAEPKQILTEVDDLERQQSALQKNLEGTSQKLAAARLGESLERGQQSQRLEIIEQPTLPQKPVRPKRTKWLALVFMLGLMSGGGTVFMLEALQNPIRQRADILKIADSHLIVTIPYITTNAELARRKRRIILGIALTLIAIAAAVSIALYFLPPVDILFDKLMTRLNF
jgi:uncharacterized protein involved in exopolysaccharide biosynthesis